MAVISCLGDIIEHQQLKPNGYQRLTNLSNTVQSSLPPYLKTCGSMQRNKGSDRFCREEFSISIHLGKEEPTLKNR